MRIRFFVFLILFVMFTVSVVDNPSFASHGSSHHDENKSMKHNEKSMHHTPHKGMCAPGFVSLGNICVLNDRCGPGAYTGKVCTMDGKTQPYLKPLHQGHVGIAAKDVICAEPLQLIFQQDVTPACVKPESVSKLETRGWSISPPVIACTLEYSPVCGVNEKTYGNMCMLNADHVAMKSKGECIIETAVNESGSGLFPDVVGFIKEGPTIDSDKGYHVTEIADGVFWLIGSGYQTMFLTTGQGVIAIDAPQSIGEKYISAINEVTDEPVTHMIYSHHHQDHTGAAGQIFPAGIQYISHKQTADILAQENDPNRPIPTIAFDEDMYALTIGDKTLEMYFIGNYHFNGDLIILIPENNIAMVVDLLRPDAAPYRAFAVTPDIDMYLQTHDMLINEFDFDVLVSGHTGILATKEHIKTNKEFTLDVMSNVQDATTLVEPDMVVQKCVDTTTEQWQGKLNGLDQFMTDHCQAMKDYILSQQP